MTVEEKLRIKIEQAPMSFYQWGVVALCFLLNMNDGMDVLLVSFTASDIVNEFGLTKSKLGFIFSSALVGMTLGCFSVAPLGDKLGRRKIFLFSLSCITIGMFGMQSAPAYWILLVSRLVTGLGIGGILPTMATIVSEYSNNRTRDFNVGLIQGGWPLGAILTGIFCTWAIPEFGWRFTYLIMGFAALVLLLVTWAVMPESVPFLSRVQPENALITINGQLAKMKLGTIDALPYKQIVQDAFQAKEVLTPEYRKSTIRLWVGIFFGFLTLYTLMSWVPTIAKDAGMPFELATYVGMALNLGAFVGVVIMGWFVTKVGSRLTLLTFMVIAFILMIFYSRITMTSYLMMGLIFLLGFFVQGGFNAYFPTATRIYPSHIRSTGIGLAFGIGRVGAIIGPFLFGYLADREVDIKNLFIVFSLPLLISGVMAYTIPSKNLR